MSMSEYFYTVNDHGDLVHRTISDRHDGDRAISDSIPMISTDRFGIFFDNEDGVLHKHGRADGVEAFATAQRTKLNAGGFSDIADDLHFLALPVAALHHPSVLEEINRTLSITGYAKGLQGKLEAAIAALPEKDRDALTALMAIPA